MSFGDHSKPKTNSEPQGVWDGCDLGLEGSLGYDSRFLIVEVLAAATLGINEHIKLQDEAELLSGIYLFIIYFF